jgi:FixJ family two-component response regulator
MKAGAVEFMTKPFDEEVLLGAIQDAIGVMQELDRIAERWYAKSAKKN